MFKHMVPALRATLVLAVLTGLLFPAAATLLAQILFPEQANGSLLKDKTGAVIGSRLIGQQFSSARYFHPRPSAAGSGYQGEMSAGTNLGPTSSKLILGPADDPASKDVDESKVVPGSFAGIKQLVEQYRIENGLKPETKVPVDAVTRSASGLDPHISQANALLQAARVARARGIAEAEVLDILKRHWQGRQLGVLGEPCVNVLEVNLALDR